MRSAAGALALLALAAGCGGDDGDGNARTVEGPESSTTAEATEARGGDGGPTETGATPLEEVVVQLGDLPTGWTATPPDNEDDADDEICDGQSPLDEVEPVEEAESNFQQGDLGPFVVSIAGRFPDEDTAGSVLDRLADTVDACQTFTEVEEDGTEVSYTFEALSFPDLGDDTYAARLSGSTPLGPLAFDFAFTRVDSHVLGIVNGGFGAADSELTEELLRTMLDRL